MNVTLPVRFHLWRTADLTGVSGTGFIADGVLWDDGSVVLKWRGERSSIVIWRSLDDMMAIHGHDESTEIRWVDPV